MGLEAPVNPLESNPGLTTTFSTNILRQGLAAPKEQLVELELLGKEQNPKSLIFLYFEASMEF